MQSQIVNTMSQPRFGTYLAAAGFNAPRALELYIWNAKVGATFHPLIQAVEVGLRNRINQALIIEFGADWARSQNFLALINRERANDLAMVSKRLQSRGLTQDTNQIVASLSFGFWVGLLSRRFNPDIWSKHLHIAFPNLEAGTDRDALFQKAREIADFRNRISHHEPLNKQDLLSKYASISTFLHLICPPTTAWVKPHCEIPTLVRHKP